MKEDPHPTHEHILRLLYEMATDEKHGIDGWDFKTGYRLFRLDRVEDRRYETVYPDWDSLPDHVPSNADEITPTLAVMALEMEAESALFVAVEGNGLFVRNRETPETGKLVAHLNMNDTFYYACADAEEIQWSELPDLWAKWRCYGHTALVDYVARKRGQMPIPPVMAMVRERLGVESYEPTHTTT